MLEQIRQSIEQAQMVLVGIGTEFAVKEEAQEDPLYNEGSYTAKRYLPLAGSETRK